jgi:phthiocerol/phenolphthiocerol synthesis type-I polyketide synthase E
LIAAPAQLLVEAGPGATLTRLARGAGVAEAHAIATQPPEPADGHAAFLGALGRLWVAGVEVDRSAAAGNAPRRVSLPGYPFERVRLWIEPDTPGMAISQMPEPPANAGDPADPDSSTAVIADVWREVLGVTTLGPDDDFLALGGDSLIAVRIATKLRQRLGCDVAPADLLREGTVAGLARLLATNGELTGVREEGWL